MRKITFGGANSLDNFFARKDDAVDWLMWSDEAAEIMKEYWKSIDAILMGRRTYEISVKNFGGENIGENGVITYVFSRMLKPADVKNAQLISANAVDFIRTLKQEQGGDICLMGGGNFAKTLFDAGLIDEIGFNIHPLLLGGGIPIFYEMKKQIDLELIECRPLTNGCVYVKYRVVN